MNFRLPENSSVLSIFAVVLLFFTIEPARAQMFSVGGDDRVGVRDIPGNGVYLGFAPASFEYKGSASSDPNAGIYDFDGPILRAKFETPGFEVFIGVAGRLTGLDHEAYFSAGVQAERGLRVVRSRRFQLELPLMLKSSITTVTSDRFIGSGAQFQQGTLSFGAGGRARFRLGERFRLAAGAVPNYGFSFATGGTFGGQIFELESRLRFYVDRLFGDSGLSFGWDYGFKRFDVEENEFDYNLGTHSILVGLTF